MRTSCSIYALVFSNLFIFCYLCGGLFEFIKFHIRHNFERKTLLKETWWKNILYGIYASVFSNLFMFCYLCGGIFVIMS